MKIRSFTNSILYAAVVLVGIFCIFQLPWQMPSSRRIGSDSYNLGFNNSISTLAVGVLIIALLFLHLHLIPATSHERWRASFTRLFRPARFQRIEKQEYLVISVFCVCYALATWAWYQALPQRYFGEIDYPFSRSELVLLGYVPFRDFQWNYGPFLLYLPVVFVQFSNGLINLDVAYVLSLIVTSTLGFFGAYYLIAQFRTAKWQRIVLFFLLCSSFNVGLGAQHTYLRFVMPFVALFLFHRIVEKTGLASTLRQKAKLCLWATALCLSCFLVSPDNGVAFYAGLLFYSIGQFKAGARWFAICAVASLTGTLLLISAVSVHYFHSLISFGGGGANYPVYATPHIIFYLASLFLLIPALGACGWINTRFASTFALANSGALMAGLCASISLLAAAALGRCDANHVFTNGLVLFLIFLAFIWRHRFGAWYVGAFVLIFTVGANFSVWYIYENLIDSAMEARRAGKVKLNRDFTASDFGKRNPTLQTLKGKMAPLKKVGMPIRVGEDIEIFLRYSGLYNVEYYAEPRSHVFNDVQLAKKLKDISAMPYVIVQTKDLHRSAIDWEDFSETQSQIMSRVFMFPIPYSLKKIPYLPEYNIIAFIQRRFTPLAEIGDYTLLKNNSVKP